MRALPAWDPRNGRQIVRRIVVDFSLRLVSATHLGRGSGSDVDDLALIADALEPDRPLLTGASLAGAARSYLREREHGFFVPAGPRSLSTVLFGSDADDSPQSHVIVDDALADPRTVGARHYRTNVRLDADTGTAADEALFSLESWPIDTTFPVRFEFCQPAGERQQLVHAFFSSLLGFEEEPCRIRVGAKKHRGYGQLVAERWSCRVFDVCSRHGLLEWLRWSRQVMRDGQQPGLDDHAEANASGRTYCRMEESLEACGLTFRPVPDAREWFHVKCLLTPVGALMIKSGDPDVAGPDHEHIRDSRQSPIVPSTSLAGALRARASRICSSLSRSETKPDCSDLVNDLFGVAGRPSSGAAGADKTQGSPVDAGEVNGACATAPDVAPRASHLLVAETKIEGGIDDLVFTQVKINRFTQGAFQGALFNKQPLVAGDSTRMGVELFLKKSSWPPPGPSVVRPDVATAAFHARDADLGLLLLLIKDLCTEDLVIGGEAGIGRGRSRLSHDDAVWIQHRAASGIRQWNITADDQSFKVQGASSDELELFVRQFWAYMTTTRSRHVISITNESPACARTLESIPTSSVEQLTTQLAERRKEVLQQCRECDLRWFYADTENGVVWGTFDKHGNLILAGQTKDNLVAVRDLRIFGPSGEIYGWMRDDGCLELRAILDQTCVSTDREQSWQPTETFSESFDEQQLLVGEQLKQQADGFTELQSAEGRTVQTIPTVPCSHPPVPLTVRYYINREGPVRVVASRLVRLGDDPPDGITGSK